MPLGVSPALGRTFEREIYPGAGHGFLRQHDVAPYSGMPVWMPPTPGREGFARFEPIAKVPVVVGNQQGRLLDNHGRVLNFHYGSFLSGPTHSSRCYAH